MRTPTSGTTIRGLAVMGSSTPIPSATSEDIRENAVYRVICSIIDMTFDEESQPGSESVDQDDSNVLDLESILDKYFLLTADRQYNIVDVLPSSTSITICSSNIAMD